MDGVKHCDDASCDVGHDHSAEAHLVPVTVLTGYLGSGKTTLLNHILTASHGKKIAVIENEFGEVGIDDTLLKMNAKFQTEEDIYMMNGCICCTVRQDLVAVLVRLAERAKAGTLELDAIVIETTGLADPAPVAQTFFVDDAVKDFCRLDGIVTLVDAKHIEQHLDEEKPEGAENEAIEQVAFADRLLLNKTDLVSDEADLGRIEARLRELNKFAPITRCQRSEVDLGNVLHIRGFDLARTLEMDPEFLNTGGEHVHDSSISSFGLHIPGELDLALVQEWMSDLLSTQGTNIFRMKGVLAIAHAEQKYVYQGVHMVLQGEFAERWGSDEARASKLTFIGKSLDRNELSEAFAACLANEANLENSRKRLRFALGDAVECNQGPGGGYKKGVVDGLLYRDESFPPGVVAPYRVTLANGGESIYVPQDSEAYIRRAAPLD